MGFFTEYDILTGNPGGVIKPNEDVDSDWYSKYNWQNDVRVINKNGKISDIGEYTWYG